MHPMPRWCCRYLDWLTPLVIDVGSGRGEICSALALHNADGLVGPRELLRHRLEGDGADVPHSGSSIFCCVAVLPGHGLPSSIMIPNPVPVPMPPGCARLRRVPMLVPVKPSAFPKPVISLVMLNSDSTPSDPMDLIAPPVGLNFSSNSFCALSTILTCAC